MNPSPRLLLTIDYESWFSPSRRYDLLPPEKRFALDDNFCNQVIDPILEIFDGKKVSFYLVGELIDWYPDLPQKIANAGHEIGLHCQIHRPLTSEVEIEKDFKASAEWRKKYNVQGYRAPMINTIEAVYPLLEKYNFTYSSSIYAPSGNVLQKGKIQEVPVSTLPLLSKPKHFHAPRKMDIPLVIRGEFPYGSSMMSGLFRKIVFNIIEKELKAGMSPVIFLHPYEIISPENFIKKFAVDMLHNPLLYPFTLNKSAFLKDLLKNFPTSTMKDYLNEHSKS
ncbi:MAG: hypothetical protein JNK81_16845 [Anaerolineales bacterium]|nr:hypothetical protein [Anaerolineales bacterium]